MVSDGVELPSAVGSERKGRGNGMHRKQGGHLGPSKKELK